MADVLPFRGWRYDLAQVGDQSDVVCPPYDVIDARMQDDLYKRHACNVVRLELNRTEPADASAAAAVLTGDDAWAARILGAREAVTERTGVTVVDPSVRDLRDRAEREARARLGPDRWVQAHAAGRSTSIDAMLKDIDRALRSHARS